MRHQLIRRVKYLLCLSPRFVMFCLLTSILNFSHFVCPKSPKTAKIFSKMTKYPVKNPKLLQLFLQLIITKTSDTHSDLLTHNTTGSTAKYEKEIFGWKLIHHCFILILFIFHIVLLFAAFDVSYS